MTGRYKFFLKIDKNGSDNSRVFHIDRLDATGRPVYHSDDLNQKLPFSLFFPLFSFERFICPSFLRGIDTQSWFRNLDMNLRVNEKLFIALMKPPMSQAAAATSLKRPFLKSVL